MIRNFNTFPQVVPVAQPQYLLVPAAKPFVPSLQGGIQPFIFPNTNQIPNQQPQGFNIYQRPTKPFAVPSPFSQNQKLPACNVSSRIQTNHYQAPQFAGVLGACTSSQGVVQVPTAMRKVVPNSAHALGPSGLSSKPVRPPKRSLVIEKDIFSPSAGNFLTRNSCTDTENLSNNIIVLDLKENQRMANLRDVMGHAQHHTDKSEIKITYSLLPRSRSKKTCLQREAQSHVKITSSNSKVNKGCSSSILKVSGPPIKKAKLEDKEVSCIPLLVADTLCGFLWQFFADVAKK